MIIVDRVIASFVTIMCQNDELSSTMSWLFTKRFRAFYLIFRKQPNPSQNVCYSHSFNFHVSSSSESVSKETTQLIIELNSSLQHIIVTRNSKALANWL